MSVSLLDSSHQGAAPKPGNTPAPRFLSRASTAVRGPRHSGAVGNGPTELPEGASRGSQPREAPQPGSSGTRGEGAAGRSGQRGR